MKKRILSVFARRSSSPGREQGANVTVPAHASMGMVVRKFTGRYECGCEVDVTVLQPDRCEFHPMARKVFKEIDMGIQHTQKVQVPADTFTRKEGTR